MFPVSRNHLPLFEPFPNWAASVLSEPQVENEPHRWLAVWAPRWWLALLRNERMDVQGSVM